MAKETSKEKLEIAKLNLEKAKTYVSNVQREFVQAKLNVANEELKELRTKAADSAKTHEFLIKELRGLNHKVSNYQDKISVQKEMLSKAEDVEVVMKERDAYYGVLRGLGIPNIERFKSLNGEDAFECGWEIWKANKEAGQ